ncbi:DUF4440 domain-containing protein [Streptomyces sp. SID161]|nr:DUF4440 domain-containing protein [Streptomyces sp. SID161]
MTRRPAGTGRTAPPGVPGRRHRAGTRTAGRAGRPAGPERDKADRSFHFRGVAALTFRTTAEVIHCFNRAFIDHDASTLADLIADDCVMEAKEPAPDGTRYEGRTECLEFCRTLAEDRTIQFEPESVVITGERATVRWRCHFRDGPTDSVRGVSLTLVRDGLIVESLGYGKTTGDAPPAKAGIQRKQGKS